MERIRVKSSNLRSIGYDESTQILEIEFQQGGIYQYFGVSKKNHDASMKEIGNTPEKKHDLSKGVKL